MVKPENLLSVDGQHTLQDMVELEMYLVAQTQQKPWPLLTRRWKQIQNPREPYCNPVESGAARELVRRGFVEATSSQTFVVSKSGLKFYEQEIKFPESVVPPSNS